MTDEIVLYDLVSTAKQVAFSPSVWKVRYVFLLQIQSYPRYETFFSSRYALNIKGLPYKTIWLEFADIERVAKEIGCVPVSKYANGAPRYSVPMIHDPSTGVVMAESFNIVEYLDKKHPMTPRMISQGTLALHKAFEEALSAPFPRALTMHCLGIQYRIIRPEGKDFYRSSREKLIGKKLEDLVLTGEALENLLGQIENGLATVASWYQDESSVTFSGNSVGFADLILCGRLIWLRTVFGEDSPEWKKVASFHDGRWGRLLLSLKEFETVH
jgi:glutathione S-transferase